MTEQPTIYAALADVMAEVSHVAKRDFNQHHNFNFRGIDAVVNAVGPALRTHRVIVVPVVQHVSFVDVTTSSGKPSTACRVQVDYVFHGPAGDSLTTTVLGEAWDNGDKAAPKAMSVAFRIALLQALALPTDERDPDHDSYEKGTPVSVVPKEQMDRIGALMHTNGLSQIEAQLAAVAEAIGRTIANPNELTADEATVLEEYLANTPAPPQEPAEETP